MSTPHLDTMDNRDTQTNPMQQPNSPPAPHRKDPYRIILTDDHALVRDGLRKMLETEGDLKIVGEAETGEALLELLEVVLCDLVILDLSMPGRGGLRTLTTLQQLFPDIRTLVLTMHNKPEYLREAIEARAAGYILKDERYDTLVKAIRAIRDGQRVYSEAIALTGPPRENHGPPEPDFFPDTGQHHPLHLLTRRELQIIKMIARGKMNKEIAGELNISKRTVEFHRANLMEKLNLRNLSELVRLAVAAGIS